MPGKSVNLTTFEISLTRAEARYNDETRPYIVSYYV